MIKRTLRSRGDRRAERGERVLAPHARQQEHRGVRVGLGPRALERLRARVAPPGRRRRRALALAARERAQLEEALRARRRLAHDLVVLEALRLCLAAGRRPADAVVAEVVELPLERGELRRAVVVREELLEVRRRRDAEDTVLVEPA